MGISDKILSLTKQLYPSGRAFKMPKSGFFEKLHISLALSETRLYNDAHSVLDSLIPDNANFSLQDITDWERRLGLISNSDVSTSDRKAAILRKMNHPGSVRPRENYKYIQSQLQKAGFNVWVFENRFLQQIIGPWTIEANPVDNQWTSVTYGAGTFVAVASSGSNSRVMTSSNGVNWIQRNNPVDNNWTSVAFGNGIFVAVSNTGTGNRVMTSPNGIFWTIQFTPADNNWTSITYGNGLFVAGASTGSNRIMTSPDGVTWTLRSTPPITISSLAYGGGVYVGVSNAGSGNKIIFSSDGITWNIASDPANNQWTSVVYGAGKFVAVAKSGSGDRVMVSPNGSFWSPGFNPVDNDWQSVAFGDGLFRAVANTGTHDRVMISDDGTNWTTEFNPVDNNWNSLVFGDNIFVAVSQNGSYNRIMISVISNAYQTKTPMEFSSVPLGGFQLGDKQLGQFQLSGSNVDKVANSLYRTIDSNFDLGGNLRSTFFIGAQIQGDWANVQSEREIELRQLVLKLKPSQSVAFLLINFI